MVKDCFFNYFKRFKYFFICFGLILLGLLAGAGIFYGGLTLTLNTQDPVLKGNIIKHFEETLASAQPYDIISLRIVKDIYLDSVKIAGNQAYDLKVGITISAIVAVLAIYGAYKGSVGLVNYLNKRQLRNKKTKKGFVPFVIKLIIGAAFSILLFVLLHLWTWSFIFIIFFYVLIDSFEAVVSIKYIYFSDRSLRKFLFSKQFLRVMGVFLIYQYGILIIASALWFASPFLSLFIMIPALAYNETNVQYTIISSYKNNK